jgi:hypothetical protein
VKDKHQLRSYLGLCTYYRKFISGFADIAKPLTQLTEERRPLHWFPEAATAFHSLKDALCTTVVGNPQSGEKFVVDTDASNVGIGVLSQVQDGRERVFAYFSKTLSKAERNYCVTRRELLAIVKTLEHCHKYMYGQQFHLRTDYSALTWLLSFKNLEGQSARLIQRLQEYNFTSEHRQGRKHNNADALSGKPCREGCSHCQKIKRRDESLKVRIITTAVADCWDRASLRREQVADDEMGPLLQEVEAGQRPEWKDITDHSPTYKGYWAQWKFLMVMDGALECLWESADGRTKTAQVVIPSSKVEELLTEMHGRAVRRTPRS